MIRTIQLLRNIGQFDSVTSGGAIPFERVALIYAENGRGKTTLTAVIRSLTSGDPDLILERRRLTAEHPPHVVLGMASEPSPAVFENGAWNRTLPDVLIFDDKFVDENVHSGLSVEAHHRQNLHELILGSRGVELSRRLHALAERIEVHNRALRESGGAIPAADRGPFNLDQFCDLPERADIDDALMAAEHGLAAAREHQAIASTAAFDLITLPSFDLAALENALSRDLPAVEADALRRVQEHLAALGHGGEAWVSQGMTLIPHSPEGVEASEGCPFCGQDLDGSPVIDHYRLYFGEEYEGTKRHATEALDDVSRVHGGDAQAAFERSVRVAVERRQFWSRFCLVPEFSLDTAAIVRDWRAARDAVIEQLRAKLAALLDPLLISDTTRTAVDVYSAHSLTVDLASLQLAQANQEIAAAKEGAATAEVRLLETDVARLKAIKARHTPHLAERCETYLAERAAKHQTETERERVRNELDQQRVAIFNGYQTAINVYLQRFNAGFRLDRVLSANTRGGATCTYNVLVNETPIAVAGGESGPGEPSFRNTLSAGDRNALALAFFFASLDQDPSLADKLVVIDDPISSLDDHRTVTTANELRRLSERAGQLLVLSHDKPFLCRLWEQIGPAGVTALELARDAQGSTIRLWNVREDAITEHDRRYVRLADYLSSGTGDLREIARAIRPHLEGFLRVAHPAAFPPGRLLGTLLNLCEQRVGAPDEIMSRQRIDELREVSDYANRFHHDTNPAWETEAINDGELRSFVERTFRFAT